MGEMCDPSKYLGTAEVVLREDLESLSRLFSEEERIEFWNKLKTNLRRYLLECSPKVPRDVDKVVRGKFRLAQLLLAASFKVRGEEHPEIVSMFKDKEYNLLFDFEKYKIFDNLDVSDIVEFIRMRKGRVYEFVMEYYSKQYNMLEKTWADIVGDLAFMINLRYKHRREKIEKAVMEYVRRYGLLTTISEIEEAVKKTYEADELRRKLENEIRRKIELEYNIPMLEEKLRVLEEERERLLSRLRDLEDKVLREAEEKSVLASAFEKIRAEKEKLLREHAELISKLKRVEAVLSEAASKLESKKEELLNLSKRVERREASGTLESEAELLAKTLEELLSKYDEYRSLYDRVLTEKQMLENKLREVEAVLKGEVKGRPILSSEAKAFEEALVAKISYKLGEPVKIYDPLEGKVKTIKSWDKRFEYCLAELENKLPKGKGVVYVKEKGVVFRRKEVVIEALTLLHIDSYKNQGFDVRPVGLDDIVNILSGRISEAEKGKYYHVLIISSPTGFTDKVIEYIGGSEFHRMFTAKHVTVYLVDPVEGSVFYNEADRAAKENYSLALPYLPEERILRVMNYVLSDEMLEKAVARAPSKPFLRIDEIARETKETPDIIRQALLRLEREGKGYAKITPSGIIVFYYSSRVFRR